MSNRLKKEIINKHVTIDGAFMDKNMIAPMHTKLDVLITNDSRGKTLSINNDDIQFTIPFEPIEQYLK